MPNRVLWSFFLLLICSLGARGYIVLVDSYSEECFHDFLQEGAYLTLKYEVLDGGFREVDVVLKDAQGHTAYGAESRHGDFQMYRINRAGKYRICFGNSNSSRAPKLVMFDFQHFFEVERNETEEVDRTEKVVAKLSQKLEQVKNEMTYICARWQIHLQINEQSNKSLIVWALGEFIVIVSLCVWQTYYLLRFFETKRIV